VQGLNVTIKAEKQGRNLHLTLEGADPFVVRPLPGRAGVQITDVFLRSSTGQTRAEEMTEALMMAVDGAVYDADTDRWKPLPEEQQTNWQRIGMELSQAESEDILMPAFFWQTILGMDGVRAYIEGGGGTAGALKATGALSARMGLLARRTSPRSA